MIHHHIFKCTVCLFCQMCASDYLFVCLFHFLCLHKHLLPMSCSIIDSLFQDTRRARFLMPSAAAAAGCVCTVCCSKLYFKKEKICRKMTGQREREKIIPAGGKFHTRLKHSEKKGLASEDCSRRKNRATLEYHLERFSRPFTGFEMLLQHQALRFLATLLSFSTQIWLALIYSTVSIDWNKFLDLYATERLLFSFNIIRSRGLVSPERQPFMCNS